MRPWLIFEDNYRPAALLAQVYQLQTLLPICSYCKKIRDDGNYWHQVEGYLSAHTGVQFSHGVCPACYEGLVAGLEKREVATSV